LGENIGDLGGINAAYDGLQLYLKKMEMGLMMGTQSNVSLCLGLQSGDLKHVMKRLKR
jgi:predicted metalloendopeptidase